MSHPGYSQFLLIPQHSSLVAVLTDELLIELWRALMMPFSSPWILNMFGFCSELLDTRGNKMNSRPWKWFKDTLIPNPDTTHTQGYISLTAPCPVPCPCQDDFSFSVPVPWRGKSTGATSALRQHGHEEFHLRIPSVRKANVSNDICLKTPSFSWIHSVLSSWPLRPKECHLLIIQDKKTSKRISILAAPVSLSWR